MKGCPLLITLLLTALVSCSGQPPQVDPAQTAAAPALGQVVSEVDSSIWYILQTDDSDYWFGSSQNGLYRYRGARLTHYSTDDGLPSNHIRGIQQDSAGNLFITTLEGISLFDGASFTTLSVVPDGTWQLEAGDLWFSILGEAGGNGVYRYDGARLHHLTFPKHPREDTFRAEFPDAAFSPYEVYSIYRDRDGNLWFGTSNLGVCRFDGRDLSWLYEDQLTNTPEGGSFGIRSIFQDSRGDFWFNNTHYRYRVAPTYTPREGSKLIDYQRKEGMGSLMTEGETNYPYYFSMVEDRNGKLWMATYDRGVLQYDGAALTQYLLTGGQPSLSSFTVYLDKADTLWIGTQHGGVYRFIGGAMTKAAL
ncbi:MAG: two-component regulator propeller domain-containing protein [Lewinella sp.]